MTGIPRFFSSCLAGATLLLCVASSSQAALLAYEPFDYPVGQQLVDNTLNGGAGFDGAWRARQNVAANSPAGSSPIVAGSLAHPTLPVDLPTSGNSVLFTGEFGSAQPTRSFSAYAKSQLAGAAGTTTWLSFLSQRQGQPEDALVTNIPDNLYGRGVNVSLFDNNANVASEAELIGFGNASNAHDNTTGILVRGAAGSREGAYDPPGATPSNVSPSNIGGNPDTPGAAIFPWTDLQWIVARIDHSAGNDDVYMWINPDPKTEPLIADADATILKTDTNGANLDYANIGALRPFIGNNTGSAATFRNFGVLAFDEFRIGTEYADMHSTTVVPEPASIALLLLSGLTLMGLGRRRS
jgi:hypothetical protein